MNNMGAKIALMANDVPWYAGGEGVYGETIALLGIGAISRHLLRLLKPFQLRIIADAKYLRVLLDRGTAMSCY
jgi:phosphoglycerate dehydrogenase-like enzyme